MKKVQVYPAGFKVYDDNGTFLGYMPDFCGEGIVFKDDEAFRNSPDEVCYIPELAFEGDFMAVQDAKTSGETHNTIVEQVMDVFGEDYMLTEEQAEYFAKNVFNLAEWACISTYLAENFQIEDCIEFDGEKNGGVFTKFQYEAVMYNMTPKEYADRQLSYAELMQLDNEFDTAFIVDEDCEDDWSEKGLGANARITYIEQRRTGIIDGPEEFDCDEKWRK